MRCGGVLQVTWMLTLVFANNNEKVLNPLSWDIDCLTCLSTSEHANCPSCLMLYKARVGLRPPQCDCSVDLDGPTDLGIRYYPRFVSEVRCDAHHCPDCVSPFQCQPIVYPVPFLVKRQPEDDLEDTDLPITLRLEWKFETVKLGVGCNCTE